MPVLLSCIEQQSVAHGRETDETLPDLALQGERARTREGGGVDRDGECERGGAGERVSLRGEKRAERGIGATHTHTYSHTYIHTYIHT